MAFLKRWKTNWELKSLTFEQLFNVILEVITKQLDEVEKEDVKLEANLVIDYEADSVDIVAMTFVPIKPDFDALEKRQKIGELYPNPKA